MEIDNTNTRFADARESTEGYVDAGHNIIKCSNCDVPLVDVWVTRPDVQFKSHIVVLCGHCGDKSFLTKVKGAYDLGITEYTEIIGVESGDMIEEEGEYTQHFTIKTGVLKKFGD